MSGPCLTYAALGPLPAGCSCEKAAMRRPERQPQRSLRQSASVVSSPPLRRTCHDVRSSASWSTKSVSRRQQSVSTYTRHAVPLCTRAKMVGTEGLGSQARQAKRPPQGQGRRRAQARGHPAPHVGGGDRIHVVEKGGCCLASTTKILRCPRRRGKRRPCRDGGGGEIVRFFASSQSERPRLQH